jgi:thioredoxin 1
MKTAEMYETTILQESASRPVLVFFSAPWCGPCRLTNPVIKDVKQQFSSEIDVVEVCTDDLAEIAEQAGVVSIPTIQFYYQGEKMDTIVGCVAKSVLANAVSKVLEDVSQIKTPTS